VPELCPFRGLRYDQRAAADASALLCPPYDVISIDERDRLAARDPHNAVHLELPRSADGTGADAAYEAAARLFNSWQTEGVLRRDEWPLIYLYEQRYTLPGGAQAACRGFFCRLRLEPFGAGGQVRPHERTMSAPKEDRYRLLRAVKANLSPVIMLYVSDDSGALSERLLTELMAGSPEVEARTDDGVLHRLWAADPSSSRAAAALLRLAGERPLTIADGHHRYETALRYRQELRTDDADRAAAPHDFVMALLHHTRSGGLSLLPTHRVLKGAPDSSSLFDAAGLFFSLIPEPRAAELIDSVLGQASNAGEPSGAIGLWTRQGGALLGARREMLQSLLPASASEELRWLDVTVLSSVLPRLLGSPAQELVDGGRLMYTKDAQEAVALVDSGQADACFLLAPTPVESVLAVAAAGEQMPQKSTYFYPKAATGLVFNPLSE
jgi:uncharacterized protein (DUF1015 family)